MLPRPRPFAALLAFLLLAGPAGAQGGGFSGGGYGGFGDRPDYGGPPVRSGRPAATARACVTSRGVCDAGPRTSGVRCECRFPGTGRIGGAVREGYSGRISR